VNVSIDNRAGGNAVALETTLLVHGVPADHGLDLARELSALVREQGAEPAIVGIVSGNPVVGITDEELIAMLSEDDVPKVNLANVGLVLHRRRSGATTVSGTMALCAASGVRVFATGGIGGVHREYGTHLDISADLMALTRYPVAVVTSGCKSVLDVMATRESLETLGVPVVGFGTDRFPAFYLRESEALVDERFDRIDDLAQFVTAELDRSGRGIVIANPIPVEDAMDEAQWTRWLGTAQDAVAEQGVTGRAITPALLSTLHNISEGATLRANLALVRNNAVIAARLRTAMSRQEMANHE